jgi:serine/threonine-protein kinase
MSAVYKATDPNLRRAVAVKLIHPHLSSDPEFVRRFEQEAAAVAQLRHPNIIQVFDFNHDNDVYYMVLEFVPGQTLQSRLAGLGASGQQFSLNETISIMATVCDAVGYAHQQGMIHRDLKPANVMLTPKSQPILMDFGVAKMLSGTSHTATGAIIGTAKYMSPEQARGERPDARTDIYSLGVMLYEMVGGQPPFDADTTVAVLMKHVTQPVPDIRQLRSDIPDALVAVIEKSLEKRPVNRFQTTADMAAALRAVHAPSFQPVAAGTSAVEGTRLDATNLHTGSRSAVLSSPSAVRPAPPTAQAAPSRANSGLLLAIGGLALLVVLLLGAGGAFVFSRLGQSNATPPATVDTVSNLVTLPSAVGMVKIPTNTYTLGVDQPDQEHAARQQVNLPDFWLDRFEATNARFAEYLAQTGVPAPTSWFEGEVPADLANNPVQGLTWDQADAFCLWAGKRLPTEAEWEAAARGLDSRLYPWGNDAGAVSLPRSGTYKVGSKATNQTPSGLFDMAGNVWEWVGSPYAAVPASQQVLRGGANGFVKDMAFRLHGDPTVPTMIAAAGVRCAADQVDASQLQGIVLEEGVLYKDTFADPGSGWPVLAQEGGLFGYHPPDFYHLEISRPNQVSVITRLPDFDNVTIEADVRVDHTDTDAGSFRYGLTLRRRGQQDYYAFAVSYRAKSWQVLKSSAGGLTVLAEGQANTLRGFAPQGSTPDASDQLRVDAADANFAFFINGQPVTQLTDPDYRTGEVGFFVETVDETLTHVHFDSLTIRDLIAPVIVQAPANTPAPVTPPPTPTAVSDTLVPPENTSTAPAPPPEAPTPLPEPPTNTPPPAVPEGIVLIPAGAFLMGSTAGASNESPEHEVTLDAFLLDKFEVSNADYRRCVAAGGCTQTQNAAGFTRPGYRDDPTFNKYPVVSVTWDQAQAYCGWAGKRLPTEAEWEYAAGGPNNFTWPWGNSFNAALSAADSPDTEPVDSFAGGTSSFGIFNMAGNVNEWVQDVFDEAFYANSPANNPVNSGSGAGRVYRGGSFANPDGAFYTTSRRYSNVRTFADVDVGFRCAADAP